jgi:hypothetical protein
MKRNFLLLALSSAFAMALLGSAPNASATCPAGTTNGGLLAGNYAIKILGAVTDTASCALTNTCPDPTPTAIQGVGVVTLDGACDIAAGELILFNGSAWSSPTTVNMGAGTPYVPAFTGTPVGYPTGDFGSYWFDANHEGEFNLVDAPSGNTFAFGTSAEAGGSEFRGARLNAGDPVIIVGEKQAAITGYTPFFNPQTVEFDAGGGGTTTSSTGVGFDAIMSQLVEHLDPLTGATDIQAGGNIIFNLDNGYDSSILPGVQIIPGGGAVICDYHGQLISAPSLADGTQGVDAALNSNWGCPLAPAHFEVVSVLWGSSNQNAFAMTTGGNGTAELGGGSLATTGHIVASGNGAVAPANAVLVASNANLHPSTTVTLTNSAAEPIDYTGISLSGGLTDVSIDPSSTCLTAGGEVNSKNTIALSLSLGTNVCTIVLKGSGNQCTVNGNTGCTGGSSQSAGSCTAAHTPYACCTSAGHGATCGTAAPYACCTGAGTGSCVYETGTVTIAGNDHIITPATLQNSTGISIPVTCK